MIKIELKNIKKGGLFRFERNTNAREWVKGECNSGKKKTWVSWVNNKDCTALVNPNKLVYTKMEYIKPKKALDIFIY